MGLWAVGLAGLFLVWSPAALAAGWWLLLGLGLAAVLALLGAIADSEGEVRDGPTGEWLALAGRAFAAAALALTAADSVLGAGGRPLAVLLLSIAALFVLRGGRIPERPAAVLGAIVLLLLAVAAVVVALSAPPAAAAAPDVVVGGPAGAATAAAFLLVLFPPMTGDPVGRSAIRIAVVAVAAGAVGSGLLLLVGPQALAEATTPLRLAAGGTAAGPLVAIAAVPACLLALVVLARRDAEALVRLADAGEVPGLLTGRNPRTGVPAAGQLLVCLVSVLAVAILDADALLAFAVGAGLVALLLRRLDSGAGGIRVSVVLSAAGALVLFLALPWATSAAVAVLLAALLIVRAFRS